MSSDLNTFIQLLVVAGWIVIFLYSFFRKWEYLSLPQKILLPIVCLLFSLSNTTLFSVVNFATDWFSIVYYSSQIFAQIMFGFSFIHKERKMDLLKESEMSLDVFKKICDNAPREIFVVEYRTGVMVYSNNAYQKAYKKYDGEKVEEHWSKEIHKEFSSNNDLAYLANGKIINVLESISVSEKKHFSKFFAVMNGKDVIIGMSR